jgi:uncharacterized membrane protein YphA (DoxX/SURF4 family)
VALSREVAMKMEEGYSMGRIFILICRIAVGTVFLLAGLTKIGHPVEFALAIGNYRILPEPLIGLAAVTLPWIEVAIGLLLIIGFLWRGSALVAVGLMAGFIGGIVSAMVRGLDIECGCFSPGSGRMIGMGILIEDLLLFVMGLLVLTGSGPLLALENLFRRGGEMGGAGGEVDGAPGEKFPGEEK